MEFPIKKRPERFKYQSNQYPIQFRLLLDTDLASTLEWRNQAREFFNTNRELTLEEHLQWYKNYQEKTNDFTFIIENSHGAPIGQVAVYNIDWQKKSGEFGRFMVNPEFSGKGFMKKACAAFLDFLTQVIKLRCIFLELKADNLKAKHLYSCCGFSYIKQLANDNFLMEISISNSHEIVASAKSELATPTNEPFTSKLMTHYHEKIHDQTSMANNSP